MKGLSKQTKLIVTLLVTALFGQASVAAGKAPTQLTAKDQMYFLAIQQLRDRPVDSFRIAAMVEAASYSERYFYSDPASMREAGLQYAAANPLAPGSFTKMMFPAKIPTTLEEAMASDAKESFEATRDPLEVAKGRAKWVELGINGGAFLAARSGNPYATGAAAVTKVVWPYLKDEALREAEQVRDEAVRSSNPDMYEAHLVARAFEEVRNGTPLGKILAPYMPQLSSINLKLDPMAYDIVRQEELRAALAVHDKAGDKAAAVGATMQKIEAKTHAASHIENAMALLHRDLKIPVVGSEFAPKNDSGYSVVAPSSPDDGETSTGPSRATTVSGLGNAEGSFLIAGYLAKIGGDNEGARKFNILAGICHKSADLLTTGAASAPMIIAAGWVGVAMLAVQLFESTHDDSNQKAFAAINAALERISHQIESLRLDLQTRLAMMDNRLGNLMTQNIILSEATLQNTQAIKRRLAEIQEKLINDHDSIGGLVVELGTEMFQDVDNQCFQIAGGRILEPPMGLVYCRNVYWGRAVKTSREALSDGKEGLQPQYSDAQFERAFPFANRYHDFQQTFGIGGAVVPNPEFWMNATSRFIALTRSFPKFFEAIDVTGARGDGGEGTLDAIIRAGEDVRTFRRAFAVDEKDGKPKFRRSLYVGLLERIRNIYKSAINEFADAVANAGVNVDVGGGANQQARLDTDYAFMVRGAIPFCPGRQVDLLSVNRMTLDFSGGSSGHSVLVNQAEIDANFGLRLSGVKIQSAVENALRAQPFQTFHPDRSLLKAIDKRLLVYEQLHSQTLSLCIMNFAVRNLNMVSYTEMTGELQVAYVIKAPVDGQMQELAEMSGLVPFKKTFSTPQNIFSDGAIRPQSIVEAITEGMKDHLDEKTMSFDYFEGESNHRVQTILTALKAELSARLANVAASTSLVDLERKLQEARAQLLAATMIGLNHRTPEVERFVRYQQNPGFFPTIEILKKRVYKQGKQFQREWQVDRAFNRALIAEKRALNAIERAGAFEPDTTILDSRIAELRKIREVRERVAAIGTGKAAAPATQLKARRKAR